MSVETSQRVNRVSPSATLAVTARAAEMRAAGHDVIGLGAGEPDFDTPEHIKQAAIAAIGEGFTKYTAVDGIAELKEAICAKFRRDNSLEYEPSQVIVSSGAKQSLFNLCTALLNPGDEVIVPAPCWVSYPDIAVLCDGLPRIVYAGPDQGFRITPQQLEESMTDSTRLLMLNSPSNPTGATYTRAELEGLGEVLSRYPEVLICTDDMYEHIYWGDEPFCSFAEACPDLYDRTITVNGVSKAYAMTGWRIGYAAGPKELIAAMKKTQGQSTSNPASISQKAALAALNGDQECVQRMTAAFRERHDYVVAALNELPGVQCLPGSGTFYAFPDVGGAIKALGLADDAALAEHLIEQAGVALVPGSAFHAPGFIRLSFATSLEVLEDAMGRLKRCLTG